MPMRMRVLKSSLRDSAIPGFLLKTIFLFFTAFLMECPVSLAAKYEFKAGGLSLWLPDDWGVDLEAKTMTGFSSGKEAFLKLSLIPDANNLNAAFRKYPETLQPDIIAYRETTARSAIAIAGIDGFSAGGEGIIDGIKKRVQVFVFKAPRAFVVLAWSVAAEKSGQYKPIFERIAGSITTGL
jgi:hypothetical protein